MINLILISAILALAFSQAIKAFVGILRYGQYDLFRTPWRLIWASGMPSSHSAFTISPLTLIGLKEGLGSSLFGLSFLLACIAIYDRGRMFHIYSYFQKRFPSFKKTVENDPILKDLVGHSVSEIAVGVVIGCATGILVYLVSLQSRG